LEFFFKINPVLCFPLYFSQRDNIGKKNRS
jgi:hypothetical protein